MPRIYFIYFKINKKILILQIEIFRDTARMRYAGKRGVSQMEGSGAEVREKIHNSIVNS